MQFPADTPRWRRYLTFWRSNVRRDVDDELRFHFESRIEELVEQGAPPDAARARAVREFGDVAHVTRGLVAIDHRVTQKRGRDEWLSSIKADILYSLRSLRRTPGVAAAILGTLALGVGVNSAMFTFLDTVFLRPPAGVVQPEGVRRVWWEQQDRDRLMFWPGFSYPQYKAASDAVGNRAQTALFRSPWKTRLGLGESALTAQLSYASATYFTLLGVHASIGRIYTTGEDALDAPASVAVVSDAFWRRSMGADSSVVGRRIHLAGEPYIVIGVAAPNFDGIDLDAADVWIPLSHAGRRRARNEPWWQSNNINAFIVLMRPAPGANERELEQRMTAALRRPGVGFTRDDTLTVARYGSIVASNGPGDQSQEVRIAVRLAGVALIVLLIACANVVNLLLARAIRRRREIAVRLALGVSRARLVRLLLAESVVLASGAAGAAVLVAYWGGTALRALLLPEVHWTQSPLDWRVVLFAAGVALVSGILAGLIPALQASAPELTQALKANAGDGGGRRSTLRACLVGAQAALSVVLLVGAMLFVRSLSNVRELSLGFDAQQLLTASVGFDDRARSADPSLPQRLTELSDRIAQIPGVEHTALISNRPMYSISFLSWFTDHDSAGAPQKWPPTVFGVSPGYFATAGIHIVRGHDFPPVRGPAMPPAVVVNEEMARLLWPAADPIGRCIRFTSRAAPCYGVIAVVANSRRGSVVEEPTPQYYLPVDRLPDGAAFLGVGVVAIRVRPNRTATVMAQIRTLIRQQFPGGIPQITRLSDYLEPQYRPWRLGATLFTGFGVLALVVALVGIYSTMSYDVNQRTQELGVRIALGARLPDVLTLVVGDGMRSVVIGVTCGIGLTLAGGRLLSSLLYGVAPHDPRIIAGVVAILIAIAVLASLAPAWRASRVDPVTALRAD